MEIKIKKYIYIILIFIFSAILISCTKTHEHSYIEEIISPTCTNDGYTLYACECGDNYKDKIIKKLDHSFNFQVINSTCANDGYTLYTCECGEQYKSNIVEKKEHEYGEWVIIKNPTDNENGLKELKCINCDHKIEEEITELVHTHKYLDSEMVESTCTTKGYTLYKCECGATKKENHTNLKNHEYGDYTIVVEQSESDPGLKERKCVNCEEIDETTIANLSDMNIVLDKSYFVLAINEVFSEEITCALTNGEVSYKLVDLDFDFLKKSYDKAGLFSKTIIVKYRGYTFTSTINFDVKDYLTELSRIKLELSNDIEYVFGYNNNLYICDDCYIYKYDLDNKQLIKKLDLKCIANAHYIDGNYLYITANYPYCSYYSKDEECRGTVTQIDLNTFEIYKQVDLNYYPYSIIVDKRGYVIISKGNNDIGYLQRVNMDTGELKKEISCYALDYILYCEERDSIITLDVGTTKNFRIHPYNQKNDAYYYSQNDLSADASKILLVKNGLVIKADTIGYYKFNSDRYDFEHFSIQNDINRYYKYEVVECDDNYVYYLAVSEKTKEGIYDRKILINDIYTKTYRLYEIEYQDESSIINLYSYNNCLYITNSNNELITLFNR